MTPLEHALTQLGVTEATGNNDGVPAERYNNGEAKAWCAAFVAWCFAQAGTPLPGNQWKLPAVEYMEGNLRIRDAWWPAGLVLLATKQPRPGDIVFYRWRLDSDPEADRSTPARHVELVEAFDPTTVRLTTIGGNVRNAVRRNERSLTSVTGFARWPRGFQ